LRTALLKVAETDNRAVRVLNDHKLVEAGNFVHDVDVLETEEGAKGKERKEEKEVSGMRKEGDI
jgi:hypothetical protein